MLENKQRFTFAPLSPGGAGQNRLAAATLGAVYQAHTDLYMSAFYVVINTLDVSKYVTSLVLLTPSTKPDSNPVGGIVTKYRRIVKVLAQSRKIQSHSSSDYKFEFEDPFLILKDTTFALTVTLTGGAGTASAEVMTFSALTKVSPVVNSEISLLGQMSGPVSDVNIAESTDFELVPSPTMSAKIEYILK